ncbi:MAG: type II/IV secretion system ATPase subunit [Candidatus Woesearchaeota archaeon]
MMLKEIAEIFKTLVRDKNLFNYHALSITNEQFMELQRLVFHELKSDPLGCYTNLHHAILREKVNLENELDARKQQQLQNYLSLLTYLEKMLEKTRLLTVGKAILATTKQDLREAYRQIFSPMIKPDFMFTKIMSTYPKHGQELDNYTVGDDIEVTIFKLPDSVQYIYHVMPPEFELEEEKYELLDNARRIMAEHKPKKSDFIDPEHMRKVFYDVGHDLLEELAAHKNITLLQKELEKLTEILVRHTIGFGIIEVLLRDEKIQDISVNSPMGKIPIFLVHADYEDCKTNIIPTETEAQSWASKLRMISGRPLDEANPILDTELELPGAFTRVSVITKPLDPTGLAFSFRRHRDKPWTLPLFIKYKMISSLGAGLLSFLIDGTRSFLICGTRGSGKSSFLSSLMVEIMRRYRIITIEDTLELPVKNMIELGFNIQQMKVASALIKGGTEFSASEGIRATLRLGDSALIVGEVRSTEAKALYEAMRVGAAANVVAGTIHGDSPYGIYDRVVNDIGVPKTSFKATDIIIIANPIRSADGLHRYRRVIQITEVRKDWEEDPLAEKGFVDLMKYNPKTDLLEPTDALLNGDSEIIKAIAGNIKEFAGNWDAVWENIMTRAKIKEELTKRAIEENDLDMLEAPFVIKANDLFHNIVEIVKERRGTLDHAEIYTRWKNWLEHEIKKRKTNKW